MRILHIVPSYKPAYIYGGPIESVSRLCEGLVAAGHDVQVYTTTANGKVELDVKPNETVLIDGVAVTFFWRITKDHTHISPSLWLHLLRTAKCFDIIHIHSWWNPLVIIAAILCHIKKCKVIVSPRGMLSEYIINTTNKRIKKLIHLSAGKRALRASYFHATSELEFLECTKLIKGWKGYLIPNVLSLPFITTHKRQNVVFTLLFMSRIHPKKGIEYLLEAVKNIESNVCLRIAGAGEDAYISELKDKIRLWGIEHKVQWVGWLDRQSKFDELASADLFVLLSLNENFANVVIESLHIGTPVLLSNKVGLASFVENQNIGWVVELEKNKILETVENIINDQERLAWIHDNGQEIINRYFSPSKLIQEYVKTYTTIIETYVG